ncbi:hypothetical protein [Oceanobacillus manasiensis]|uniref:hypothetical protein n=1 Tax=Oceanobacillus manasiensis TaxID=586413 RepID=UPI0005A9CFAA|nr:hypothetical protein [Oceanobacillus manasiensis]
MDNKEKRSPENEVKNRKSEKRTELDSFEEQKFVDDIPMDDLNKEMKEEKEKTKSKNSSQSEKRNVN